jgi:hypothetical protein
MVGKKGFLRIVEALIGVLIVIGFLLIVIKANQPESKDWNSEGKVILDEIAKNDSLRTDILNDTTGIKIKLRDFAKERFGNPIINLSVETCNLSENCAFSGTYPTNVRSVYAVERIISTMPKSNTYGPRKVKMFIWSS